jgi:hypothetical protein
VTISALTGAAIQAPTQLPLNITELGQVHKIGGVYLVNPGDELQLLGSTKNANDAFEWTSENTTVQACFIASGPYVIVPSGCLESQRQYTLQLSATTSPGIGGVRQVSRWCTHASRRIQRGANPALIALHAVHTGDCSAERATSEGQLHGGAQ